MRNLDCGGRARAGLAGAGHVRAEGEWGSRARLWASVDAVDLRVS